MTPDVFKDKYINDWNPTPLVQADSLLLKCEQANPTGSVKSRGIVWQVLSLLEQGETHAVLSSSGNAAIAAAYYADKAGIMLHIFVAPNIEPVKHDALKKTNHEVIQTEMPIQAAQKYAKEHAFPFIRQSLSIDATQGFRAIAYELQEQMGEFSLSLEDTSIFVPVSSGTTFVGLYEGLQDLGLNNLPQLHIVQTSAVHPLASQYDQMFKRKARSIAGGIIARETSREDTIHRAIQETQGSGWVVDDTMITEQKHWLIDLNLNVSNEGAAALAGQRKACAQGFPLNTYSIILLT